MMLLIHLEGNASHVFLTAYHEATLTKDIMLTRCFPYHNIRRALPYPSGTHRNTIKVMC